MGHGVAAAAVMTRMPAAAAAAGGRIHVHRSLRVWALYLDLEESLGTVDAAKAAYERCIALGVATPAIVLNTSDGVALSWSRILDKPKSASLISALL